MGDTKLPRGSYTLKRYKVKEIFGPTIQGEGTHTGLVVTFVRFSGCNRWSGTPKTKAASICSFCDTDFLGGDMMTADEIANKVLTRHVVLSGGEPLLQVDFELIATFNLRGVYIHIETNGSIDVPEDIMRRTFHISMSPKQTIDKTKLRWANDIKLLYPAISPGITVEEFAFYPCNNRRLQPVWDEHYEENKRLTIEKVYKERDWKISLQLHKYLDVK